MAQLFNITHDACNLDEYDSTVTDNSDLSADAAAALASTTCGLQCVIDDTTGIYGQKNFTQITSKVYRYRFYIDPNTLTMAANDRFKVAGVRQGTNWRAYVRLYYDGTHYEIRFFIIDDAATWHYSGKIDTTDAPQYVEVLIEYSSGNGETDAVWTLWINGVQKDTGTGFELWDQTQPDNARLGACEGIDAGTHGTLYLDEFILRDDDTVIGPVVPPTLQGFACVF